MYPLLKIKSRSPYRNWVMGIRLRIPVSFYTTDGLNEIYFGYNGNGSFGWDKLPPKYVQEAIEKWFKKYDKRN